MKAKKLVSLLLTATLAVSVFAGCGNKSTETDSNGAKSTEAAGGTESSNSGETKQFTAFFAVPGSEINDDNEIMLKIGELTGATCK